MSETAKLFRNRPIRLAGKLFLLNERDCQMLEFLWKWKQAPTATLHEVVGSHLSPYSTYKALERLEKRNYVESVISRRYGFRSWQLTDLGFESIREGLGELKEEGYLSENPWHDRNVLAFQLGEWSRFRFPAVSHFGEQELRRRSAEYYPPWVPSVGGHRADGYTRIAGESRSWTIAYEVELSCKSKAIYESVFRFYRMHRGIDRVYWLVEGPVLLESLINAKACARDPLDNYHLFVDLAQYQRNGWDAPVVNCRSETLFTIRENIRGMLGESMGEYIGNKWGQNALLTHYDPNKVLGKQRK